MNSSWNAFQEQHLLLAELEVIDLLCLQYSDDDFGGETDVSSDVWYVSEGKVDLVHVVLSRWLLGIQSAIKKLLDAINV